MSTVAPATTIAHTTITIAATTTIPPATTTPATTAPSTEITETSPAATSPLAHLDSFHATATIAMTGENGTGITITGEGLHAAGDFSCTTAVALGPITISTSVISVGDEVWFDAGSGSFVEASLLDPQVSDVLTGCPGAAPFWAEFDLSDLEGVKGVSEDRNDQVTQRIDISEVLSSLNGVGIGVAELEGMDFDHFVLWMADPAGWLVSLEMDATVDAALLAEEMGPVFSDAGTVRFEMTLDVDMADDPSIEVLPPQ